MKTLKYVGLFLLVGACTTTQVDQGGFQDGTFTAASYDKNLDERDTMLRTVEESASEVVLQNSLRRDFYLPSGQLANLNKRAKLARQRLNSESSADPVELRVLAVEALVEGRPEQVQGYVELAKSKRARRNLSADDQLLLGISTYMMGDPMAARRRLTTAASSPGVVGAAARANLGLVAMKQGAFLEALDMFRQAESLDPKNTRFLHMVAEAAHASRKHALSVDSYKKIISIEPNDFLAHYNLGLVYHYGLRRYGDAIKEFQLVIDHPKAPRDVRVLADGAFANVRREQEGMEGIATTGFQ